MALPIRPLGQPQVPARTSPADATRTAAQKAFFDAAMKGVAVQTVTAEPREEPARRPDLRITLPESPPERIPRPGSILDIKV